MEVRANANTHVAAALICYTTGGEKTVTLWEASIGRSLENKWDWD